MNNPTRNRKGFTLIELLTVIAIIGILAAVLFPGVQGVMKAAKKSSASTKLGNIGKAYVNFNNSGGGGKFIRTGTYATTASTGSGPTYAANIAEYAACLAFNVELNQAELWYVDADPANDTAVFPKNILDKDKAIVAAFKTASADNGYISWTAYTNVPKNINTDTPLVWSRGLSDTTGAWDTKAGVWGSEGGHVAFGDGHVVWLANTTDDANKFASKKTPGDTTKSWKEAVNAAGTATELSSGYTGT